MNKSTNTYKIGTIKKLIDLNGTSTNFELNFRVSNTEGKKFYLVVVDQTTLDGESPLDYKEVTGSLSGNIVADKNVYQNYFLILKADEEIDVNVELEFKEIEKYTPPPPAPIVEKEEKQINWTKILICIVLVSSICAVVYWLYFRNKTNSDDEVPLSKPRQFDTTPPWKSKFNNPPNQQLPRRTFNNEASTWSSRNDTNTQNPKKSWNANDAWSSRRDPPKRDPPRRDPPKRDPPRRDPPKRDPPKRDPPKRDPPKRDPPKRDPSVSNSSSPSLSSISSKSSSISGSDNEVSLKQTFRRAPRNSFSERLKNIDI